MKAKTLERAAPLLLLTAIVVLWQAICSIFSISEFIFPSPIQIVQAYAREPFEAKRFRDATEGAFQAAVRRTRARAILTALAIILELNHAISLGQMLMLLVAAVCCFWIGRIVEGYAGS